MRLAIAPVARLISSVQAISVQRAPFMNVAPGGDVLATLENKHFRPILSTNDVRGVHCGRIGRPDREEI